MGPCVSKESKYLKNKKIKSSITLDFQIAVILTYLDHHILLKLLYWNSFQLGTAPVLIGIFFFAAMQLFFIGILGEYIAAIYVQVQKRPLVIEQERINFPDA